MDERPFESLNMVPFIDIMLVLLVIVLTTSSLVVSGRIPVKLPEASAEPADIRETATIEIDAAGVAHYLGEPLAPEALRSRLGVLERTAPILLRADQAVALQRFIDVADLLKQLGFTRVAVQTQGRAS
ncbi:ExbD/TolR family protein [Pseudorhodoferax soli]|uniref:Biopolymer transport protein ExbD n=1 Tax=Pseudorhodoferax soli TaxID=545864 RepID=A0A368XKK7_9BURK|nr:biopolymer transporter ExbD [Pseudorhodoferax soli]RCW68512.1 biopolymer transport protein ExbD [Pseudorhodoferax soli]